MGGILGFTDVDNAGLWGLELRYNDELTGQNGRILTAKNAWGYDMPTHYQTLVDAVPGSTLTLTIDANIQHWLESALSAAVTEHHVAERGVGIVMDVHTGAVLAMSCQPDYDPNAPRSSAPPPPAPSNRGVERGVVVPSSAYPAAPYPQPARPSGGPGQSDSPY